MSWHPGSDSTTRPNLDLPVSEPTSGTSSTGMADWKTFGAPTSCVEQSIQDAFSMGYGCQLNIPSVLEQSSRQTPGYHLYGLDPQDGYPAYEHINPDHDTYGTYVSPYIIHPAPSFQTPQWPPDDQYTSSMQASEAQMDPDPVQHTLMKPLRLDTEELLPIAKKKSNDLIGIGLYDNEDQDFLDSANKKFMNRDSIGRDLKLEETWQPPVEDTTVEDDDAHSEDEAEPAEIALTDVGPLPTASQTMGYPAYGDLSNQSFFFEEDEGFAYDDPYANYLNFDQGLQQSEPKKPGSAHHGVLWY